MTGLSGKNGRSPGPYCQRGVKQKESPPPGLYQQGNLGLTPRTGTSGADHAGGSAATQTGSSGEMWPDAPDWIIWG